jgi:xanthine dehydrogenase YagS FAD-binding subunit
MKPFAFSSPKELGGAIELLEEGGGEARVIAGGSDLLGELKEGSAHYATLVSLQGIQSLRTIEAQPGGLRIGAGVSLALLEHDDRFSGPWRILAEAVRSVATPEIRNQATLGGNLCQRPRCLHFRSRWIPCLKKGGADCPALKSRHQQYLSVMGGEGCFSAHPSDLAPALLILEARVIVAGRGGEKELALEDFFSGPETDVLKENVLAPGELLAAVVLPDAPPDWRGVFLKARERNAGDFALVSVAFGCRIAGGMMRDVRLALGCYEVEKLLEGGAPSPELAAQAGEHVFSTARPLAHNGYKIDMGRALVARAVEQFQG